MLVFCNITNKIRKRTDTVVAFTQKYSRVSYPLGNVSTLSNRFRFIQGHTCRCGEDRRDDFLYLESMSRRRDHVAVILRAKGIDRLIQADSSNMCSIGYPNVED